MKPAYICLVLLLQGSVIVQLIAGLTVATPSSTDNQGKTTLAAPTTTHQISPCPPYCDCDDGSNIPFGLRPFFQPAYHVYCTITDESMNFSKVLNAVVTEQPRKAIDVHIKCYGDSAIEWSTSEFLATTFALRIFNCSFINPGSISFPSRTALKFILMDTIDPMDIEKIEFDGLNLVNVFQITFSNLTKLPKMPFMPTLIIFSLEGNRLKEIECQVISNLCRSCRVDLTFNVLTKLPNCSYNSQNSPSFLLANNALIDVMNIGPINAINLDLSSNRITDLPTFSFKSLITLNVSNNNLKTVSSRYFAPDLLIKSIDLSNNEIESIEAACFSSLLNLNSLSLLGNKLITYGQTHAPIGLTNVRVSINLDDNQLRYPPFTEDDFRSEHQFLVSAARNPYICDCGMKKYKEFLQMTKSVTFANADQMLCSQPPKLGRQPLAEINLTRSCPVLTRCPLSCQCEYYTSSNIVDINCAYRSLLSLPLDMPEGRLAINISHNYIEVVDKRDYLSTTVELYLSSNQIKNITSSALSLLADVMLLDLKENNISHLPRTLMDLPFKPNASIFLANNPWQCSCDLLWFPHWLRNETLVVRDKNELECHLLSELVVDITSTSLSCQPHSDASINYAIAFGVLIVIILMLTVILVRYRTEVKVLLYTRIGINMFGPKPIETEKSNDIFLVCSDDDMKWTIDVILARLEGLENPPYTIIFPERDFLPGTTIEENLTTALSNSACSVFVFGATFQESEWCLYYFHAAYEYMLKEKDTRVVIIVKDNSVLENMDDDLQAYFKTHTYLDINDKLFWDKLVYVLPKHRQVNTVLRENLAFDAIDA